MNPEHTVPTLNDNGKIVWDSHVIAAYLADTYGKDDKIYPKDPFTRAKVNQRLFFDASSLFPKLRNITYSILWKKGVLPSEDDVNDIYKVYDILESFLATDPYLVGGNWTIADVSVANTVLVIEVYAPITAEKYPKISGWLERVNKNVPHFTEINGDLINKFKGMVTTVAAKNKAESGK